MRFIAQHLTRLRVFQRRGIAEHPVRLLFFFGIIPQHGITLTARVGAVATGQQHAAFLRRHNARRRLEPIFIDDHRLCQKRLDQMTFQRGQGVVACVFVADAG